MREQLLTVDEAAELMRVNPRTVRRWVRAGRLDCLRAGNRILFDARSLVRWLRGRKEAQDAKGT